MLEWVHRNRQSFLGLGMVLLVAMLMTGFGMNLGGGNQERSAIVVNDAEVGIGEFFEKRRELERFYRQQFGERYDMLASSLNVNQQVVDSIIAGALFREKANEWKLMIGDSAIRNSLMNSGLFQNGFDINMYTAYLAQLGMTSKQFEDRLRKSAESDQLRYLVQDLSYASKREVKSLLTMNDTKYTVDYLEFDPTNFVEAVSAPSDDELDQFYQDTASGYETPESISYAYLVLDPADFSDLVEITPDDVEFYYVENEKRFSRSEQVKVRHIQLSFDPEADPAKRVELKEKASEIRERLLAGESFDTLVIEHSDDFATRETGGDLGWISRGEGIDSLILDAAFKLKGGGISEVVSTGDGYRILSVEGYNSGGVKPIEEVSSEIEKLIRKEQAPLYTLEKAHELFDRWSKSDLKLDEFSAENNMVASSQIEFLTADRDPEALTGLTRKVLGTKYDKKQLVEVGDKAVLVGVREYKEAEVPLLTEIQSKVLQAYKEAKSSDVAREKAQGILEAFSKGSHTALKAAGEAIENPVKTEANVTRQRGRVGLFADSGVQQAIFSTFQPMGAPSKVHSVNNRFYLLQVTGIEKPEDDVIDKKLAFSIRRENQNMSNTLVASLINGFKANAEIIVHDDVYVN